ncbi:MAG TPA: rhomboid family intramembrane serine protease [Stellaceae bacterium]|nr:rhomboid family intramembrane serine protease [Stellaceae bacterium]
MSVPDHPGEPRPERRARRNPLGLKRFPAVTIALIAASIIVFLLSGGGTLIGPLLPLLLASRPDGGLQEVMAGQVWRLVTPIFVHFGVLHIFFNMVWLWDLGRIIETRRGPVFMALLVLVSAVVSDLAQYAFSGEAFFGGMSGVVYALFGYVWIQGLCNPTFGLQLRRQVVLIMIGWLVLCWTGLLGPIANYAHAAGLALGAAGGWLSRNRIARSAAAPEG